MRLESGFYSNGTTHCKNAQILHTISLGLKLCRFMTCCCPGFRPNELYVEDLGIFAVWQGREGKKSHTLENTSNNFWNTLGEICFMLQWSCSVHSLAQKVHSTSVWESTREVTQTIQFILKGLIMSYSILLSGCILIKDSVDRKRNVDEMRTT